MTTAARSHPSTAAAWATIGMEAAVALPVLVSWISGWGPLGALAPLVPIALLVAGLRAHDRVARLRFPRARLVVGSAAAVLLRVLVAPPPLVSGQAPPPLLWPITVVVASVPALAGWWRGGDLADAELTPRTVRSEFLWLGGVLVAGLVALRGTILASDVQVDVTSVVLFAISGLLGITLARQESAGATGGRAVVVTSALVPLVVATVVVAAVRPALLAAIGATLGSGFNLLVLAVGWLLEPLFRLLALWHPSFGFGGAGRGPARPDFSHLPRVAVALPAWLQVALLILAGLAVLLLLAALIFLIWTVLIPLLARPRKTARGPTSVEAMEDPGQDLRDLLGALGRWASRFAPRLGREADGVLSARAAYRRLLRWSRGRELDRAPGETPRQFQARLADRFPAAGQPSDLLTRAYERERYGSYPASADEVAALRAALDRLSAVPFSEPEPPPTVAGG